MAIRIYPIAQVSPQLITVNEIKKQLKLDASFTEEDDLIAGYIDAAINTAENYTASSIKQVQFKIVTNQFINNLKIDRAPITVVDSIKYYDASNEIQTLDSENYELVAVDKYQQAIYFENESELPTVYNKSNAVEITVTAGYTAETLPQAIKQAIFLIIGSFYENRQDSVEALPKASTHLLNNYRFYY